MSLFYCKIKVVMPFFQEFSIFSLSWRNNPDMWVGQKSRSDRDWKERDPPNRVISREVWRNVFRYIRGETRKSYEITYILTSVIRTSTITLGSSMVSKKDV